MTDLKSKSEYEKYAIRQPDMALFSKVKDVNP
jgi:hypothetical protein